MRQFSREIISTHVTVDMSLHRLLLLLAESNDCSSYVNVSRRRISFQEAVKLAGQKMALSKKGKKCYNFNATHKLAESSFFLIICEHMKRLSDEIENFCWKFARM